MRLVSSPASIKRLILAGLQQWLLICGISLFFFGIPTQERRALTSEFLQESKGAEVDEVLTVVQQLYDRPERECLYLTFDLLEQNYRRFSYPDFQQMYPLVDRQAWWDSVDSLRKVMSLWVKGHQQHLDEVITRLLAEESMWQRRIAITLQLMWKEQTNTAWLERASLQNCADPEFFIQKAIGWALRDYGRANPDWVRRFLAEHELSRLAVREGGKYL